MAIEDIQKDIMKWVQTKKNVYGILFVTVMIIVLGLDFQYWHNNIALAEMVQEVFEPEPTDNVTEEGNYTLELAYSDSQTGTVSPGAGGFNPASFVYYDFPVDNGTGAIYVNCTGDAPGPRDDLDLYVYDSKGSEASSSADADADERIVIDDAKMIKRGGYGSWQAEVHGYTGFGMSYTITIEVYVKVYEGAGNSTEGAQPLVLAQY